MDSNVYIKQLDAVIATYVELRQKTKYKDDLSDLPEIDRQAMVSKAIAAIHRISGNKSTYSQEVARVLRTYAPLHLHATPILGIAKALRDDIEAGYIQSLVELIHGEMFGDFLEMAEHLSNSGFKDAAAVIAGSTLESHLRSLCTKAGISTETTKADGSTVPKNAEAMNSDLATGAVYSKLDQKNVTAWLGLRNKAAHGKYDDYGKQQVELLTTSVRDFITRNPA